MAVKARRGHKIRWKQQTNDDWVRWPLTYRKAVSCCDCGLVHWFTTYITKSGRVMFNAERDDAQTKSVRKKFAKNFTHKEV